MSSADLSIDISKVVARTFSGEAVDATAAAEELAVKHADLGMSADLIGKAIVRAAGMVRQAAMQPALAPLGRPSRFQAQSRVQPRPPMPSATFPSELVAAPVQPRRPDVFAATTWAAAVPPTANVPMTASPRASEPSPDLVFPAMPKDDRPSAGRVDLVDTLEAALENAFLADFQRADMGHARVTEPAPDFSLDTYLSRSRDAAAAESAPDSEPTVRKAPARPGYAAFAGSPIEDMRRTLRRA